MLISALGWDGKPEECLELVLNGEIKAYCTQEMLDGEIKAYCTQEMLDELSLVLDYDRFGFSDGEKQSFLTVITASVHIVESDVEVEVADDPDDDVFLECAVTVDADYVVSGDTDLLDLGSHDGIPILSPTAFLDRIDAPSD